MPATRITEKMLPLLAEAFARYAGNEDILWDAAPALFPNPQGQSLMGAVALYAQLPGAMPQTYVGHGHLMQPVLDEKVIDDTVRQLVEILVSSRSQQLTAMQTEAENAARNGRSAPLGGLILPGA